MITPVSLNRPVLSDDQLQDATRVTARIPQHVVYRTMANETVVLNIQTGMYYGLNESAGRMLEILERSASLHVALHTLVAELGVSEETLAPDLLGFCNDLGAKGLIEFVLVSDSDVPAQK